MKENFICTKIKNEYKYKYNFVFYSTSYLSSVTDRAYLYYLIEKYNIEGIILVDLLLSNGNSFNRFFEIYVKDKKIKKMNVIRNIPKTIEILSVEFYYKNMHLLDKKSSVFYM